MITQHFPALIVVLPLMVSFIVFVVGIFRVRWCLPLVLTTLGLCVYFSVDMLYRVITEGSPIHYRLGGWEPPWGIEYVVDYLNGFVLVGISVISFFAGMYLKESIRDEALKSKMPQFYTLFLLQVTGLLGITVTGDVFNLYVLLEIASFSAYAIIAMGSRGADFAAFRYMIFGTMGACAYLLGVGYLYIATGSLNMGDLSMLLPKLYSSKTIIVGFVFLLSGIGIKMGMFPVHTWLPDSYSLAPPGVSVLLAPLFTKVGAYVLIRVMFTIFHPSFSTDIYPVTDTLSFIASIGVLFASVLALAQRDVRRMLCYLIVAEMGYIVFGVASANHYGLIGAIFHIVNDMFMMASLFIVAGVVFNETGTSDMDGFKGLHRKMPVTSFVLLIGAFSIVGVPPTCGFFSKWYLVLGMIEAGRYFSLTVLLISSLINAVLFFRLIEITYFEVKEEGAYKIGEKNTPFSFDNLSLYSLIPMVFYASMVILLGILSGTIVEHIIIYALPQAFKG
ncbi:MAG: proton-conducting transporter membrane subunit [Syntrophorhabdaceae bacterium]|nr:proton-conducting transporter membrane subunit [Syntrophorhabdaceae bacterium]